MAIQLSTMRMSIGDWSLDNIRGDFRTEAEGIIFISLGGSSTGQSPIWQENIEMRCCPYPTHLELELWP